MLIYGWYSQTPFSMGCILLFSVALLLWIIITHKVLESCMHCWRWGFFPDGQQRGPQVSHAQCFLRNMGLRNGLLLKKKSLKESNSSALFGGSYFGVAVSMCWTQPDLGFCCPFYCGLMLAWSWNWQSGGSAHRVQGLQWGPCFGERPLCISGCECATGFCVHCLLLCLKFYFWGLCFFPVCYIFWLY